MTGEADCERCGEKALPDPIHIEGGRHRFCRACFISYTAEYLGEHGEKAKEIAKQFQLPWPTTGVDELAKILVIGLEKTRAQKTARFGKSDAT